MPHSLDQILPSLQALGIWTYWVIALFAMFEALIGTGIVVPGALVVFAGGMLVQRGLLDPFDLGWFVIAGTVLGGEASYALGRLAGRRLTRGGRFASSRHMQRAGDLLNRYGAVAMVIGRLTGPLSAFVPFSAAMAGMSRRRFALWNVVSAVPYTVILLGLGYFLGHAIGTMGAAAPRILVVAAIVLVLLAVLWFLLSRLQRALPLLVDLLKAVRDAVLATRAMHALARRFPSLAAFVAGRFDTAQFLGLTATVLGGLFVYVLGVYLDSVFDFLGSADVISADSRIAHLFYGLRDDRLIAVFGWITALGGWQVVLTMMAGATVALLILRRGDLAAGLWIAAAGNQLSVTLLKSFFDRPRSALGYFTETSGSFPSGHAAASVAVWGMVFYIGWRARLLPAAVAAMGAITLALLIGLSRIYLVEHYLSDVLNGYLVGALWLIVGIAFCEWRRTAPARRSAAGRRPLALGILAVTAALGLLLASSVTSPLNRITAAPAIVVAAPLDIFALHHAPQRTETLTGDARQPVNIVVVAPDAAAITAAMQVTGWVPAARPGIGLLFGTLRADWTGAALPDPLVIPTFWNHRPNDLGFARPSGGGSDTPRLHARFWKTGFTTGTAPVFVGTLSLEVPLDWAFSARDAAPDGPLAPARRDALVNALRASGLLALATR